MRPQHNIVRRPGATNNYFSSYSERLYGSGYVLDLGLARHDGQLSLKPVLSNAVGNPSTGTKKSEVAAFDLAYLKYLEESEQSGPAFTVHDRLESIDMTHLRALFDIAEEIDGQYVVAVLHERIATLGEDVIAAHTILTLDRDDKFFRL